MSGELVINEEYLEQSTKVSVCGEVDIYNAQQFKDRLYRIVDNSSRDILIDCSCLKYIDSTGLGIFVGALKRAKTNGKNIYLENIRENIKKLFVITGLDKLFIIH